MEDEDQIVILLNSLLKTYESFRDTMKYGRDLLTFEEVQTTLKSKQIELNVEEKGSSAELLLAKEKKIKKSVSCVARKFISRGIV